jgi:hypothetical protein
MAGSLALTLFAGYSRDRVFYGTDTRAFELLAGAALALLLAGNSARRPRRALTRGPATVLGVVAVAALGACIVLWWRTTIDADWIYRGGLPAYSLLSAAIVACLVLVPETPVSRLLGSPPLSDRPRVLRALPVPLADLPLADPERTQLAIWPNFLLRICVTTAAAMASYLLIEQPIRARRWHVGRVPLPAMAMGAVTLVRPRRWRSHRRPRTGQRLRRRSPRDRRSTAETVPSDLPSLSWFGDSTALVLAQGSDYDAADRSCSTASAAKPSWDAASGRGAARGFPPARSSGSIPAARINWTGTRRSSQTGTRIWLSSSTAPTTSTTARSTACATTGAVGDQGYDSWLEQQALDIVDVLSSSGALWSSWLTTPPMPGVEDRYDAFNQMVLRLPAERPGRVVAVDFGGYLTSRGDDAETRPDGIHLSNTAAVVVGQGWLLPSSRSLWSNR